MQQINVMLDDGHAEELGLMAERLGVDSALVARVLLAEAISVERARDESRQNPPAEHWEEFQTGLSHPTVSIESYLEAF